MYQSSEESVRKCVTDIASFYDFSIRFSAVFFVYHTSFIPYGTYPTLWYISKLYKDTSTNKVHQIRMFVLNFVSCVRTNPKT